VLSDEGAAAALEGVMAATRGGPLWPEPPDRPGPQKSPLPKGGPAGFASFLANGPIQRTRAVIGEYTTLQKHNQAFTRRRGRTASFLK